MTRPGVAELARLALVADVDVFTARRLARDLAAASGLDTLDATRVATAVSELAREAVLADGAGLLVLQVSPAGELVARVTVTGPDVDRAVIDSARRLVDRVDEEDADGSVGVTLTKRTAPLRAQDLDRLRTLAADQAPPSPLEELRHQHQELLTVLDAVQAKNAELDRLNRELEETNRGVMALYAELSDELDRTNQGVVALYAEIDDKNDQLTAASAAKSRFLRNISHELRTPVNSVLGLTRLLADPGAGPLTAEQAEQVGYIRASASDLSALVDELLNLARAESGRLDPVSRDVDLSGLVDDLRGMVVPLLRDGVELVVEALPPGLVLHTDPDLVRHVLRNLLSNAAKFTTSGTVTLAVDTDDERVAIRVADTGVGMSEDDRTRVFEEFFQARTPLHAEVKGTGLGLPFALVVAQALGGDIQVDSTLGVGSSFALRLPRNRPASQP